MSRIGALVLVFTAASSIASGPARADDLKIAYVNMAKALNDVEDGKAAKTKLKTEFDAKQKQLDKMQNELKAKKDEFEAQKGMMKPEARLAKQEDLQREFLKLQQTYMQLQQELMANETRLTNEIAGRLRDVIAKIGDRDAYTLVLDIGETVLYYKRHRDITAEVVKEYNNQYGKK